MDTTYDFIKKYGTYWADEYKPYTSGADDLVKVCEHKNSETSVKVASYVKTPVDGFAMRQEL